MAIHGAPSRFQSDQGTQLVVAAKQIRTWDWSKVQSEVGTRGAEWHLVPTGAQHFNGQAERMIGLLKPCLERAVAGRRYSYGELATVMAEAAQVVNSRPIARSPEDLRTPRPAVLSPPCISNWVGQRWRCPGSGLRRPPASRGDYSMQERA